jgi:hypothetical protein
MPKAHRHSRSQGYYRLSPVTTAASLQVQGVSAGTYAPLGLGSATRSTSLIPGQLSSQNTYYSSQPLQTSMSQQNPNLYSQIPNTSYQGNGGPVLPPQPHHQHQNSLGQQQHFSMPHQHQQHPHHQQQQAPLPSPSHHPAPTSLRPSSGAWTPHDDSTLMSARASGMNWAPIQSAYFPSKTPNACRKRHERLMERRSADDWDGMKVESMAKIYMEMRKEIWAPLAERCGEKWGVVEQKVCLT